MKQQDPAGLRRVLNSVGQPDGASLCYEFVLSLSADAVCAQRSMRSVEGNNQRIRKQLGDAWHQVVLSGPLSGLDDMTPIIPLQRNASRALQTQVNQFHLG